MKTQVYKIFDTSPNTKLLEKVAQTLSQGGLVIYPTDTVYAIGCLMNNPAGLKKFAKVKNIKPEKARFSFFFQDFSQLSEYVPPIDTPRFKILKNHLPGPYTFILNAGNKVPKPFDRRKTIGIRISDHSVLKLLLPFLDAPLVTSSIHDDDAILDYTTDPEVIFENWQGKVDVLIDSGYGGNTPSTVIDLTTSSPEILRKGKGKVEL